MSKEQVTRKYIFYFPLIFHIYSATTKEHEKDFASFDANNDGFIDAQEIRNHYPSILNEDLSAFFIASDKDEDGLVSKKEYLAASLLHEEGNLSMDDHKVY